MTRPIWGLVLWLVSSTPVWAIDFNRYHSQDQIKTYLQEVAHDHPELVRFHVLGYSEQGREIDYVVVSKGDPDALPALYMNGTHHGNEKSSTEAVLGLIDYLVKNHANADVSGLLDNYAVYLQPIVNPDGHAANTRGDASGRDPNRDYSYPDRDDGDSFKVQPIKLVKALSDKVRFRAAVAYHSGMEGVLWPWCFSGQRNPDHDTFYTLSKTAAEAMGMSRFAQSFNDYQTRGEFIDYQYMSHGTLAVTFEVSNDPTPAPATLARHVTRSIAGSMAFMLSVRELDLGILQIERAPDTKGSLMSNVTPRPKRRAE